jgi:hypothetical protein
LHTSNRGPNIEIIDLTSLRNDADSNIKKNNMKGKYIYTALMGAIFFKKKSIFINEEIDEVLFAAI